MALIAAACCFSRAAIQPQEETLMNSVDRDRLADLKTLRGSGFLKADGESLGTVRYVLGLHQGDNVKSCSGTISGDVRAIAKAYRARTTSIVRGDTGSEMILTITNHDKDGNALVEISDFPRE
jgi:hypothetical protein